MRGGGRALNGMLRKLWWEAHFQQRGNMIWGVFGKITLAAAWEMDFGVVTRQGTGRHLSWLLHNCSGVREAKREQKWTRYPRRGGLGLG